MTTINSVGLGLLGSTGTGTFVGSTSPTITTPKIAQINDANANAILTLNSIASAVNNFQIDNGSAGNGVALTAIGTDASISIGITSKGPSGGLAFVTSATGGAAALNVYSGPSAQHQTNMLFPTTAATQVVTWPDATGTVALQTSGSWTPVLTSSGGGSATYTAKSGTYSILNNIVYFNCYILTSALPSAGNLTITGLPQTIAQIGTCAVSPANFSSSISGINGNLVASTSAIQLLSISSGTQNFLTVANCSSNLQLVISGFYFV